MTTDESTDVDATDLEHVMDKLARLSRRYDVMITLSISPYESTDTTTDGTATTGGGTGEDD